MLCKASQAPPGARAGQAAGKKDGVAKFVKVVQSHKHQDVSIAWEFLEFWVNEMYWKELPPGIRGRFTEIFVDEVGWIVSCSMKLNSQIVSSSEGHAIQYCVFLGFMLQLWAHTVFSKSNLSVLLWTLCLGLNLPNHKAESTNFPCQSPLVSGWKVFEELRNVRSSHFWSTWCLSWWANGTKYSQKCPHLPKNTPNTLELEHQSKGAPRRL